MGACPNVCPGQWRGQRVVRRVLLDRRRQSLVALALHMDFFPPALTSALQGRYEFERSLGVGGMARVYLATDLRHGRKVAIKVVRDDVSAALGSERFLHEIRTTASLQHPHILALLDSGEAGGQLYYVMPYVAGESLRARMDRTGAMEVTEVVSIVRQVASALDHAHRHGVIHRDIKPENVLLADGLPVVADFGIALAVATAGDDRMTNMGTSLGTPSYMSPEQVTAARDLDGRSDEYSLACLLYEMLSGRPPFTGATAQAIMVEHVVAAIPPVRSPYGAVPEAVERAVRRALAKSPDERFATVAEFATALGVTTIGVATPSTSASIVVLPFENLSADQENAFFADGLTEEIITDLSKVEALRVISRASAMTFKGARRSIPSICGELNVRYALEGSVRRAGGNLRIAAQLSDASSDEQIWAEKYSGTMEDVFELQERLSREIVGALRVRLTPDDDRRLAAREISDVRIFECCAMARQEVWRISREGLERAQRLVEEGLSRFGRKAPLLAMLAGVHWNFMNWGVEKDERHVELAESLAREALQLKPDCAQAHFVLAFIRASRGQLRKAIDHARLAHEHEPGNPDVLLALTAAYSAVGRMDDALRFGRLASEVDPLTPMSHWVTGWAWYVSGDATRALLHFENGSRLSTMEPIFSIYTGIAHYQLGNMDQARASFEHSANAEGFFGILGRGFAHGIAGLSGDPVRDLDEPTRQWASTDWQYSWHLAQLFALNKMPDQSMIWLEHAVKRGFVNHPMLAHSDRFLDSLRERPEFSTLLDRAKSEWLQYQ